MAYTREIKEFIVLKVFNAKELADGNYLINIDLADENGEKVHTVAYENRSDVANVRNLVEYLNNLPITKGSQVIAKLVNTNNETTKMLTYLAPALKAFK
ncbi:hypothetical protein BGL41_06795 [Fructilactobacillus sanfranciscensis]|uniref:hypothetical protein n=1 Tax=Fructilactobacillus sanfranciscensis TaxID=1625 RepID=UPI000CD3D36F|nr:hypothetical protein [Fructilactobacillus sanfranciscensis]POH14747.1 hypothetical protein BGL41_06795 [Fructilactobacillus sanfranciscensis]